MIECEFCEFFVLFLTTYSLPIHSKMNNKEKLQQQDKEIRDLLIQERIIDDKRVVRCGKFSNTERNTRPNQYLRPFTTSCQRYECRVCRRELIDTQRKKHYSNNIQFINTNGSILMFTLTVSHTVKDTLSSIHERFLKSISNMKHSRSWKKIKQMTNYKFHYNNYELTETRDSGYHFHNHIIFGKMNDVSLSTIEDVLYDSWCFESMKMSFDKPKRRFVRVDTVEKLKNLTYGDKSIEELSQLSGTLESYERKFKETYESPSSQFRTKRLREIGNEIKTINTTFSKRIRRGRIWK